MSGSSLVEAAVEAARAGGDVIERYWRSLPRGSVSEKRANDFVTRADKESEEVIVSRIHDRYPNDGFLGEEGGRRGAGGESRTWIVDPLDGTTNFIAGFPFWCVSVAAREGGEIVAGAIWDPLRAELYSAERGSGAFRNGERLSVTGAESLDGAFLATGFPFRSKDRIDLYLALFRELFLRARGIRRAGSAALDLANVAAGVFDGFFEFKLSIWDIAAGSLLIEEAGGRTSDFDGTAAHWERGNVVAGTPAVAAEIVRVASGLFSDAEI
ncbi:MAG TPA: inositol monophosphatase family protein [Thermoanaerobaculia bacterium]|nr:inositol monophosphatase family protein [Thermoanaerobaculia bacterium]